MPELPEVEVVRRGLQEHVAGKTISAVRVHHPRAVRRHEAGPADLTARLLGARITGTGRRGKYLWLTLADDDGQDETEALVVHLGMSGQLLVDVLLQGAGLLLEGAQERDELCKVLTLRHTGKREASGSDGAKCWR